MPGFIIHIGQEHFAFPPEKRKKLKIDSIAGNGYSVERRIVDKFMNDRIFFEDEQYLVIVEGVVLNNHELMAQYASESWLQCVIRLYRTEGESFFKSFRGSFSGALFDKKENKWLIYTGQTGEKQVFYTQTPGGYLFGSEMRFMVEGLKYNHLPATIDETGAYLSLTHGFCIENRTLVSEVHKLIAGHYLRLTSGGLEVIQYHRFSNKPDNSITQEQAIETIDTLFRQAIRRQFEKDREYGYRHISCLSGGLDSRMTTWVAHQMGYTDQLNITYSQSGYLDFSIAQQIAIDLHHDWLFKPLDGGDCITKIDDITPLTYGCAHFFGLSHGKSMEDLINYEPFGIIHTGQIGDAVIGTFFKKNRYNPVVKIGQGAYSFEFIERLKDYQFVDEYENEEIFCLYTRAFTGANQGLLTFQENSESCSPFTDVDFLEYCYSIPLSLRFGHKIYIDWILSKYPDAAKYIWEHTGKKIEPFVNKELKYWHIKGYDIPTFSNPEFRRWAGGFILRRLGLRKKGQKPKTMVLPSKSNMNPVDYWYTTNPGFKGFLDKYWEDNCKYLPAGVLGADMTHLFKDCVVYDKLQCLSVLAATKLIEA